MSGKDASMHVLYTFPILAGLLTLAACGTTQMPLNYTPQTTVTRAPEAQPIIDVGPVTVSRRSGREDPYWIGTIRGGYGNPIRSLSSDVPVDQVVARAVRDGLRARGLLTAEGSAPQRRLVVDVTQFDANQYARREATVALRLTLQDAISGQQLWGDTVRVYRVDGSIFGPGGVFASIEDFHALTTQVLSEAVDQGLDNPGFRAALRPVSPVASLSVR